MSRVLEKTAATLFFSGLAIGVGGTVYASNHLGAELNESFPVYLAQTARDQVKSLGVMMFGSTLAAMGVAAGAAALIKALVASSRS